MKKPLLLLLLPASLAAASALLFIVVAANALATGNLATHFKSFFTDTSLQPLFSEQLKAIGLTFGLAVAGATVIAYIVKALIGLRPTVDVETIGLDLAEHEAEGYHA
jgi:ammonia channel protein AmtB